MCTGNSWHASSVRCTATHAPDRRRYAVESGRPGIKKSMTPTAQTKMASSLSEKDIDCLWTVEASARATVDALCCLPCCCFCGGCCGRYQPFVMRMSSETLKPGLEVCQATCTIQAMAAILVPCTFCLCLWGCCGTATPCAKGVAGCVMKVEKGSAVVPEPHQPPRVIAVMGRHSMTPRS